MTERKSLLRALAGTARTPPPIWLMRQAGRYLPEYRAIRSNCEGFLDLCYNPELASEVTLQPIRRFGFDAAILFSDILVIPDALGQRVVFLQGEGPNLDPVQSAKDLVKLDANRVSAHLEPVFETVDRVKRSLPAETALIGFCGAPWTVATYMVSGKGTKEQAEARIWAYSDPEGFSELIEILVAASIEYLLGQVNAGAEVLQIFDTWAGSLAESERQKWCVDPLRRIAGAIKAAHPDIPIIAFLRGAPAALGELAAMPEIDCVGLDTSVPASFARDLIAGRSCVQGNLDPLALLAGGEALEGAAAAILKAFSGHPHIFNLGHGILPETPTAHVERLMEIVRDGVG